MEVPPKAAKAAGEKAAAAGKKRHASSDPY
jgi:hypothetical protein